MPSRRSNELSHSQRIEQFVREKTNFSSYDESFDFDLPKVGVEESKNGYNENDFEENATNIKGRRDFANPSFGEMEQNTHYPSFGGPNDRLRPGQHRNSDICPKDGIRHQDRNIHRPEHFEGKAFSR